MPVTPSEFGLSSFAFPAGGGSGDCDYPAESDVREGVDYGDGAFTGTLTTFTPEGPDNSYALLHSPAEIVQQLLVDIGVATDPTPWETGTGNPWPSFSDGEPNLPDNVLTSYDVAGIGEGVTQQDGERQQHYGVQVRLRARTHRVGFPKAQAVALALDAVFYRTVTVDGTAYLVPAVVRTSDVLALGKEQGGAGKRSVYTINLSLVATVVP